MSDEESRGNIPYGRNVGFWNILYIFLYNVHDCDSETLVDI